MRMPELLDAAKAASGIPSDYRLAQILEIRDSAVANWRAERAWPSDPHILRLAEMAKLDQARVLAEAQVGKAKTEAERATWREVAERLSRVAACIVAGVMLAAGAMPENASADNDLASQAEDRRAIH